MARQGKVLRSERRVEQGSQTTYIVVDCGGNDIVTAQYMSPPGDDGLPEPGDFALVEEADGGPVALACHDPVNAGDVLAGLSGGCMCETRRRTDRGAPTYIK